jgi:hypothetical protein
MAITRDVNVSLLNECFELAPFHGLFKIHPDDVLKPSDEEIDSVAELNELDIKEKGKRKKARILYFLPC